MFKRLGCLLAFLLLSALFVSPALAYTVYVTNQGENTISIIDGKAKKVLRTVKVSQGKPHNAILSKGNKWLYVANVGSGSVSIFDPHTEAEVTVIPADKGTHGVTLSPDERQLWTANVQADTVSVIDLASQKVIRTIKVGSKPMLVTFTPDGKKAYVSNGGSGDVSVIDMTTMQVVKTIFAGKDAMG
ncbi:MAG: beta-propeller fold lactonase family protein, partial [Candidatus Rokubacteria bacterium]|nr:beta-propeller fold lactonase family protein [Candidatus Rokubacteria bacterium]